MFKRIPFATRLCEKIKVHYHVGKNIMYSHPKTGTERVFLDLKSKFVFVWWLFKNESRQKVQ